MSEPHLAVLRTISNQRFIGATNRLRHVVGASELIRRATTVWVVEAVRDIPDVEVVAASSGSATLTGPRDELLAVVRQLTARTVRDAPGLRLVGAVVRMGDQPREAARTAVQQVSAARGRIAGDVPIAGLQPHLTPCAHGLGAAQVVRHPLDDPAVGAEAQSRAVIVREQAASGAYDRFRRELRDRDLSPVRDLGALEDHLAEAVGWVAIVHVDGNDIGRLLPHLPDGHSYLEAFAAFSDDLDRVFHDAFLAALVDVYGAESNGERRTIPVLPLLRAGDDLTFVCPGSDAVELTFALLRHVAAPTGGPPDALARVLTAAERATLGAAAGIAVVKPHFPFHLALELADQLTASAKTVKRELGADRSAFDLHVHYDRSGSVQLARSPSEDGVVLSCGPYVVEADHDAASWLRLRREAELRSAVGALEERDDQGQRVIPRGQVQRARDALVAGAGAADHFVATLRGRHRVVFAPLLHEDERLYVRDDPSSPPRTLLLDALQLASLREVERTAPPAEHEEGVAHV